MAQTPPVKPVEPVAPAAPVTPAKPATPDRPAAALEVQAAELAALARDKVRTTVDVEVQAAELAALARDKVRTTVDVEMMSADIASLASARALASLGSLEGLGAWTEIGPLAQAAGVDAKQIAKQAAEAARQATAQAVRAGRYDRGRSLYTSGTSAMDRGEWAKALEYFSQVVEEKGDRADAALYWKAYCQNKLGQRTESLTAIQELVKGYPNSRWISDAKALEVEVRGASGQPMRPDSETDDDLKLLALNSLMSSDSEQVLPILQKMLQSQQPLKIKKRALFVLSQSKSPKAREIVISIAKGSGNPDLQAEAIRYLGISRSKENIQVLTDIYRSTQDKEVKRRILESFMVAGERTFVYEVARSEGDVQLRRSAINQLGAMQANEQLWSMYQSEKDTDLKRDIIRAMYVSNDADHIKQLAQSEADLTLRREAIRGLGIMRVDKTGELLTAIYANAGSNDEIRKEAINGLYIQNNAKALVDIARKETNPQMKKELVSRLATMKAKEATDYLMEIINK